MSVEAMRVTFVQSENENLAVEYFSSLLKPKGHCVELVYDHRYFSRTAISIPRLAGFLDMRDQLVHELAQSTPDLVAFSVMTSSYQWAVDMAGRIKRACDVPIVFGGVHAVAVPEVVIAEDCVDMVCVGEGEGPLLSVVEQLGSFPDVDVPGLWIKSGGRIRRSEPAAMVTELDSLPFPDKDLFYRRLPWLSRGYLIMSSRGCPYACTFCSNDMLRRLYRGKARYVRRRSVDNVLAEMSMASSRYGPDRFNMLDDCFTADKGWLAEFCVRYRAEIKVPFVAVSHPQLVDDDVAWMLADAGCAQLLLGVQSSSEDIRRNVLNRRETNEQVAAAAAACHRHGVKFSIDHIFGVPGEDAEEYRHALGFYNGLRPDAINTYWLIYFPGTTIIERALEAGVLEPGDVDLINRGRLDVSMNVGIGGGERIKTDRFYNYAFLFSLIPLLPRGAIDYIIERRVFLEGWKPPIALTLALRVLSVLKMGIRLYWKEALSVLLGSVRSVVRVERYKLRGPRSR